jgi:hypothetical protein
MERGEMEDRPENRPEERRRTGPLGDDAGDPGATRRIPDRSGREEREEEKTRQSPEGKETRVIRPAGAREKGEGRQVSAYPRGYFEAAEEREARLRDIYGGVDWLASFIGFVFAAVSGLFLFSLAGLVLGPLGFSVNAGAQGLGPAAATGLAVVGILLFLTYFFGGYVAGRLARFDGGRNGMMTLLWSVILVALLLAAGGFLPGAFFRRIQNFIQEVVIPSVGGLAQLGLIGVAIAVGAILIGVLGGFTGGRLGSRYHSEIDNAT